MREEMEGVWRGRTAQSRFPPLYAKFRTTSTRLIAQKLLLSYPRLSDW